MLDHEDGTVKASSAKTAVPSATELRSQHADLGDELFSLGRELGLTDDDITALNEVIGQAPTRSE